MSPPWTSQRPTAGKWWVSIRPELRRGFPAVVSCYVVPTREGLAVSYHKSSDLLPLDQDWFAGAQWKQREETPADPFAGTE